MWIPVPNFQPYYNMRTIDVSPQDLELDLVILQIIQRELINLLNLGILAILWL